MLEIVWGTGVADDGDKPGKASSFTTPVIAKGMSRKQTLGPMSIWEEYDWRGMWASIRGLCLTHTQLEARRRLLEVARWILGFSIAEHTAGSRYEGGGWMKWEMGARVEPRPRCSSSGMPTRNRPCIGVGAMYQHAKNFPYKWTLDMACTYTLLPMTNTHSRRVGRRCILYTNLNRVACAAGSAFDNCCLETTLMYVAIPMLSVGVAKSAASANNMRICPK